MQNRSHQKPGMILLLVAAFGLVDLGAPAQAQDLVILSAQLTDDARAGDCNTLRLSLRNSSSELINQFSMVEVVTHPTATPNANRKVKTVSLGAVQPRQRVNRTVQGLEFAGGAGVQHTVTVEVDAQNQVDETDEGNNTESFQVLVGLDCGGGGCDLEATRFDPHYKTLPGARPARLRVTFRNIGGGACPAKTLVLRRYEGDNVSGGSTQVGTATLRSIAPGRTGTVSWNDNSHGPSATYTYDYTFQGGHNDPTPNNHSLTKTLTFAVPGQGGNEGSAGCDLAAELTRRYAGRNWRIQGKFENDGTGPCANLKVKLIHYRSRTCTGSGSAVGGTGGWKDLGALAENASKHTAWRVPRGDPGWHCFKFEYSPRNFRDQNNANHRPTLAFEVK